jgi:hypothetical protein
MSVQPSYQCCVGVLITINLDDDKSKYQVMFFRMYPFHKVNNRLNRELELGRFLCIPYFMLKGSVTKSIIG